MIDWSRVRELREEVGQEDFEEVADLFTEEVAEVLARMEAGGEIDWEGEFHFLKSSALNIGFTELSQLCQKAETRAKLGRGGAGEVPAIIRSYHASMEVFAQGRPSRG